MSDDYWFTQRYDDLLFDDHSKGRHDRTPLMNCPDCVNEKMASESDAVIRDFDTRSSRGQ